MKHSSLLAGALVLAASAPTFADTPTYYPNSRHYADRNPSAATGRSGNATLATRALLSKVSGNTVLDITTGTLDSTATAPGSLTKIQVKGYDGDGDVTWNNNYTGLTGGGTAQYSYADKLRGEPYQVQANIKRIDGKRTDVVTVTGTVKLRPDLKIALAAPQQAIVGTPVNIVAAVTEQNGDTGATSNCKLLVDGNIADESDGIWIDSGDTVSCVFTVSFDTIGTHALRVVADGVVPADDSTGDNSADGSIDIVANQNPLSWWARANGYAYDHSNYSSSGWYTDGCYWNGCGGDWNYTQNYSDLAYEWNAFSASSATRLHFPANVSLVKTSGDATLASYTASVSPSQTWGDDTTGGAAYYFYDNTGNEWGYVAEYHNGTTANFNVYSVRYAGRATYFGTGYAHYWWNDWYWGAGESYYVYNSGSYGYGTVSSGPSIDTHLTLADGTVAYDVTASLPITRQSFGASQPWTCYDWTGWYGYPGHSCTSFDYAGTQWSAYASGVSQ